MTAHPPMPWKVGKCNELDSIQSTKVFYKNTLSMLFRNLWKFSFTHTHTQIFKQFRNLDIHKSVPLQKNTVFKRFRKAFSMKNPLDMFQQETNLSMRACFCCFWLKNHNIRTPCCSHLREAKREERERERERERETHTHTHTCTYTQMYVHKTKPDRILSLVFYLCSEVSYVHTSYSCVHVAAVGSQ